MLFDTLGYWIFFAAAFVLLATLRDRPARVTLVALSYVFYASWDWRFCLLLAGSTAANYAFGLAIESRQGGARQRALALAVVFNLGLLAWFKYCNFFIGSLAALLGIDPSGMLLNIALPVGISFFTFEGIAYATDIYRRQLPAVRSKVDFALFIAFFPHLVAGPIIRPLDFFPQLAERAVLTSEDSRWGMREILKGLIKKLVFADYFAWIADATYSGCYASCGVPVWAGVLAFSLQIYFDFSGYTDIARGCARLLGYRLPPNFERPYLAADIRDFWRRWHISLSLWLRDYLYIPLGGNRSGAARAGINLLIVMCLGGLWHGASWNFAIWGLYHGLLLVAHRGWRRLLHALRLSRLVDHPALRPLCVASTFAWVTLGWIPFRAADLAATHEVLSELANWPSYSLASALHFATIHWGIWLLPLFSLTWCWLDRGRRLQDWLCQRAALPAAAAAGVIALIKLEIFGQFDTQVPFLYFQF